jgi:hypothetical protein
VVGRLADRHGIRVQLRPSRAQTGTTSLVMLPDTVTYTAVEAAPDEGPVALPYSPEEAPHFAAVAAITAETVARRGHGVYETWDEPANDAMSRFLHREERRRQTTRGEHEDPSPS